ncbi:unnamed protein product [Polarella glacialis]|uniref:Uncharacterized protein n=1 Tax=Polarella glacialis TaxID=89957 RepID=A0A813IUB8_POLGL|nr:unnamed protein product [Polarella glacialis]
MADGAQPPASPDGFPGIGQLSQEVPQQEAGAASEVPQQQDKMDLIMKKMKLMEDELRESKNTIATLQVNATNVGTPASSSGSQPPPHPVNPPGRPDPGWQDIFEGLGIDWGDIDPEMVKKLHNDSAARKAFAALWAPPANKKIRKFDSQQQSLRDVKDYSSAAQGAEVLSPLSAAFTADDNLLQAFKQYHESELIPVLRDLQTSMSSAGNIVFDRLLSTENAMTDLQLSVNTMEAREARRTIVFTGLPPFYPKVQIDNNLHYLAGKCNFDYKTAIQTTVNHLISQQESVLFVTFTTDHIAAEVRKTLKRIRTGQHIHWHHKVKNADGGYEYINTPIRFDDAIDTNARLLRTPLLAAIEVLFKQEGSPLYATEPDVRWPIQQLYSNGKLIFQHCLCFEKTAKGLYKSICYVAEHHSNLFADKWPAAFAQQLHRHAAFSQAHYWANSLGTTRATLNSAYQTDHTLTVSGRGETGGFPYNIFFESFTAEVAEVLKHAPEAPLQGSLGNYSKVVGKTLTAFGMNRQSFGSKARGSNDPADDVDMEGDQAPATQPSANDQAGIDYNAFPDSGSDWFKGKGKGYKDKGSHNDTSSKGKGKNDKGKNKGKNDKGSNDKGKGKEGKAFQGQSSTRPLERLEQPRQQRRPPGQAPSHA